MMPAVWLHGRLAEGRRARILGMTLQAKVVSELPAEPGVVMTTGEDFGVEENRQVLLNWIQEPGRLLLVVPPLQIGAEKTPIRWSVQYADAAPADGSGLAAFLSGEVQYVMNGDFLTDHIRNMQFGGQTLAVGYYRPRISTGLLVMTVLPLWSVRTIDQPKLVLDWIDRLFELAGKPRETITQVQQELVLAPLHYSVLLHLSSRQYETPEMALDALETSPVFRISREQGARIYEELVQNGYVKNTSLTDRGGEALQKSPYAAYISALKEKNQ